MSQAKVDLYKQRKHGKPEKPLSERLKQIGQTVLVVAICGWICFSMYLKYDRAQEAKVTETVMDATSINEYMNGLQADAE